MWKIRRRVMEHLNGQTGEHIKDIGRMENNMEKAY